jgi:two-component system CheB/CheR fusion protein
VLIYFTSELQKRALQLFAFSLRDGGYLALGKAESTTPLAEYFVLEQPRLKVYRRQGERVLIPPARIRDTAPLRALRPTPRPQYPFGGDSLAQRLFRDPGRLTSAADKATNLLLRLPIGVVVVDRSYDIDYINGAARRLLSVHGPAIGDDLVHLVPAGLSEPIRTLIDAGLRGEVRTSELVLSDAGDGLSPQHAQLTAHPQPAESDGQPLESVMLVISDITATMRARQARDGELAAARAELASITERATRLADTNEELLDANQKLTTANAELRNANEELLVANEEVQAATEEVETLNEELQATNEELETLNEELQATVEELNTTNDDLEARSLELQDSAINLDEQRQQTEAERQRLTRVLDVVDDGVVVFDGSGQVVLANDRYQSMFGDTTRPTFLDERGRALRDQATPWQRSWGKSAASETFVVRGPKGSGRMEAVCQPLDGNDGAHVACVMREVP